MNITETEVFVELLNKLTKTEQRELISLVDDASPTADEEQHN